MVLKILAAQISATFFRQWSFLSQPFHLSSRPRDPPPRVLGKAPAAVLVAFRGGKDRPQPSQIGLSFKANEYVLNAGGIAKPLRMRGSASNHRGTPFHCQRIQAAHRCDGSKRTTLLRPGTRFGGVPRGLAGIPTAAEPFGLKPH